MGKKSFVQEIYIDQLKCKIGPQGGNSNLFLKGEKWEQNVRVGEYLVEGHT